MNVQSIGMSGSTQGGEAISIVMPAFNEAPVIAEVTKETLREVVHKLPDSELIIVDDCSTDATPQIVDGIAQTDSTVRVIHSPTNNGHGPSLVIGLENVTTDWILLIDSDGQIPVVDFWNLWDGRHEADLVLGTRVDRQDPFHRLVLAKFVRLAVSWMGGRRVPDPNVPFKLMRADVWRDLNRYIDRSALAPSIMITLGALIREWRIDSVPVEHRARKHGGSTFRLGSVLGFSWRGLRQLLAFRSTLRAAPPRTIDPSQSEIPSKIRG